MNYNYLFVNLGITYRYLSINSYQTVFVCWVLLLVKFKPVLTFQSFALGDIREMALALETIADVYSQDGFVSFN